MIKKKVSRTRAKAKKAGFRSGFEHTVAMALVKMGINAEYEPKHKKLTYTKPATNHSYLPDFILPNGIVCECKGRWVLSDRQKVKMIVQQYPELDFRMVFQDPNQKISKGSKTTYAMWCHQHGIKWGTMDDIKAWAAEKTPTR